MRDVRERSAGRLDVYDLAMGCHRRTLLHGGRVAHAKAVTRREACRGLTPTGRAARVDPIRLADLDASRARERTVIPRGAGAALAHLAHPGLHATGRAVRGDDVAGGI